MRGFNLITVLFLFFSGCSAEKEDIRAMCPVCKDAAKHGCLDSKALNYDSDAAIDNNSCKYKPRKVSKISEKAEPQLQANRVIDTPNKHGCLDFRASNYDSEATIDNNSCEYVGDRGSWSNKQKTDTINQCVSTSGESRFVCECIIEIYSSECDYADDSCVNSLEAEIEIEKCFNN